MSKIIFFFPMRPFALELKCWMIFFINVSPMGIREVWATLAKLRLSLVETHSLLKLKRKLLTKYSYLAFSYYAHYKKSGHTQSRCHSRFLEKYESQLNRFVNEFNSSKNNILHTRKWKKTKPKPKTPKSSSSSPPKVTQMWLRKDKPKCNVVFTTFRSS